MAEALEDQISEHQELLKFFKGNETSFAKAAKQAVEARLKELKEQQRQARPLPARLQAATDRCAKAEQLYQEQEAKVAAICESLKAARKDLDEAGEKKSAALLELEEVKQAAGAEPVVNAERSLTGSMAAAFASRNIVGADAQSLIADVLQLFQLMKAGAVLPAAAASIVGGAVAQQAAAFLPLRTGVPRGRSLPRDVPVPREDSSSRSPRGARDDEY